ncbi:MAG: FAD-dependent oxidoreductase [Candidatus Thiodiazotropha sp. (ex Ctena orbiculata)]|uniref:FAD-dependent oxidoreductase n=1 Tax=Candidatus Thiodiazotropha taylori TaxID=2792791 RepID=A0A944QRU4_9GAMM|nr:FAD-dependent oxidoreductase [Candidatus Thiodiazotropha taylori]MBT3028551.1 FAD-dependent oxidoreductase [Candidatus Thiodiazotropha taylori]MBT3036180.1 FAD-dependent oxidoreductase [Candidatus Thiodiazotropha taylori]MBV2138424.1 FAD-dependent oxidoreductase [Candidatus Thiodiazotropha taylori]PUB88420.1 MAG: glutamate synthase [gamma proteobacterium symbiont of Ctena orbiculata]
MSDIDPTYRRYADGDSEHYDWDSDVVNQGESYLCPTYIQRTPPCQNACPSGHDIRGWLSIVRGLDKPQGDKPWQEFAFERMTLANPFPAIMGRVCPAPCQEGCNRNGLDGSVGINSIEQYIGDWARENQLAFAKPETESGKRVAIIGGGPAGLAAALFLRRLGHRSTIYEAHSALGGQMVFGIPGYRIPRDVLEHEIQRILDVGGIDVQLNSRVGSEVTVEELEQAYDAIFWSVGTVVGKPLRVTGGEAPNCVDGMTFLKAFNEGSLKYLDGRILVIGGGDTAMDVAAVAKRIGEVAGLDDAERPDAVFDGSGSQRDEQAARRTDSDCWLVYRRPIAKAPCTKHELEACITEGVEVHDSLAPLEVVLDERGRARALKVQPVDWSSGKMEANGEPFEIECALIVAATGQTGDYDGIDGIANEWNQIDAERSMQVKDRQGHFAGGDAVIPHLLTTAIGHASIAVEGIDKYLRDLEFDDRPKVEGHHFDLLQELAEKELSPDEYNHGSTWGTNSAKWSVHNFENRAEADVIKSHALFTGHFNYELVHARDEMDVNVSNVLGSMIERFSCLNEETAVTEAKRCMSCGFCFECDNCVIYCPQDAVFRVKKDVRAMGRYVETDYFKCVGCHICKEVCPTGYIEMGLGQY